MKYLLFFIISIVFLNSCKSVFYTTNLTNPAGEEGILYALPSTQVIIEAEVTETERQKGQFSDFLNLYFNAKNAILKDEKLFTLTDITIKTNPIIDDSQIYCINSEKKTAAGLINLTPEGFISGINLSDIQIEKQHSEQIKINDINKKNEIIEYGNLSLKSIREIQYDTVYKEVFKDSIYVKVPIIQKKDVFKSTEKQAKEIADILFLLRDDRNALLKGENDGQNFPDGVALKLMLEELNNLEKQYMSLFTGREITTTKNYVFTIKPEINMIDSFVYLFNFSEQKGLTISDEKDSESLYLKLTPDVLTPSLMKYAQNIMTDYSDKNKFDGIIYRIPANYKSELVYKTKNIYSKEIKISQFGTLNIIPSEIINDGVSVEFYPQYGSLKRISESDK